MYADINLITTDGGKSLRNSKRIKNLRYFSVLFLMLVAASSVVLFLINMRFSVNSVEKEQEQVINSLGNFDETASKVIALNTRLDEMARIIENRNNYQALVETVSSNVTGNMTIEEFKINQTEFMIITNSTSLLELNEFLNKTLELSSDENVQNIDLENLSTESNQFTMTVVIKLR